jgi:hypothetical protein
MVFDIHPNEFIDETNLPRTLERRTNNIFSYLFADLIRSHLKVKNLGYKAIPLYIDMLEYYIKQNYSFRTIKDYSSGLVI